MKSKVAIVGLSWNRRNAPFNDRTFDIWSMNHGCYLMPRLDLCFDLHNWQTSEYTVNYYDEYLTKIKMNFPIVVPCIDKKIKSKQILYPYVDVVSECGYNIRNSIPAMIMYAYLKKYKYIYLFGIDDNEFTRWPDMGFSFYYTIGFVRGKGLKVYFCNDYTMDQEYLYGIQKLTLNRIKEKDRNYKGINIK